MITIRSIRVSDIPAVMRIANQTFVEWARCTFWSGPRIVEFCRQAPDWQLAAVENGEIVGFMINEPTPASVHISWIAILPTQQGKGLGARLLGAIEKKARANGMKAIYLDTPFARKFYLQNGFVDTGVVYRLMKEVAGKLTPEVKGPAPIGVSDIPDALACLPDDESRCDFLTSYYKHCERGSLAYGLKRKKGFAAVGIAVPNEFCPELVQAEFLWSDTPARRLLLIEGLEHLVSTLGRRWIGVAVTEEAELARLQKRGYREARESFYWTQYNLIKNL